MSSDLTQEEESEDSTYYTGEMHVFISSATEVKNICYVPLQYPLGRGQPTVSNAVTISTGRKKGSKGMLFKLVSANFSG